MRKASLALIAGAAIAALAFALWDAEAQNPPADPAAAAANLPTVGPEPRPSSAIIEAEIDPAAD